MEFLAFLQEDLQDLTTVIEEWRRTGHVLLGLTLSIGVFGLIVAALQPLQNRRAWKVVVTVLGLLIGVLTLFKTEVFKIDHTTYYLAAEDASTLRAQIERRVKRAQLAKTDEERLEEFSGIEDLLKKIEPIRQRVRGTVLIADNTSRWPSLMPAVFAQAGGDAKPAWLKGRAADEARVYFVGIGADPSLAAAKAVAVQSAIETARENLIASLKGTGYDRVALGESLAREATTLDTYYEREKGGYRYYALVAISKRTMEINAQFFGLRQNVQVSKADIESAQSVAQSPQQYQIKRQETYSALTANAQKQIHPDAYRLYEIGRSTRLKGDSRGAIPPLEQATRRSPLFFMAWYNLALAKEDIRDMAGAETAYKRAIALEPKQPVRDASVYNSYGAFLYNAGRTRDARPLFQKAIEIEPAHVVARRNLERVR